MPTSQQPSEEIQPNKKTNRFEDASKEKIDPEIWGRIEAALKENKGIYIFGKVGTGKTYLCHAIRGKNGWPKFTPVHSVPLLLSKMKATFGNQSGLTETENDIIEELSGLGKHNAWANATLFLDDIGAEKPTEWAQQNLCLIIDQRYENMKKTIFTSNLSLDELSERLGERIASRIAEMCVIIELKGKDRRIK